MRMTTATVDTSRGSATITPALAATLLLLLATPFAADANAGGTEGRAAELRQEAREMVQGNRGYAEAADHLVRTADPLPGSDDGKGVNLRLASRMYHYAGLAGKAYRTMLDAGTALYRAGRPLAASHAFLDAAQLAVKIDRMARAWEAANLAGSILHGAEVSPGERQAVLDRVQYGASTLTG